MFATLQDRLAATFKNLRGKGRLSEADIDETCREIRIALLEADVALPVVRDFVARVKERALGAEVSQALNPAQQVIKIVDEELVQILGGRDPAGPAGQDAADRRDAAGPAGRRQDDAGRQARAQWFARAGPRAAAGRRRPAAAQRRRPSCRSSASAPASRCSRPSPATASATRCGWPATRSTPRAARQALRRRHRRHRRPARDRRRADAQAADIRAAVSPTRSCSSSTR